jgi:hypothetical protein
MEPLREMQPLEPVRMRSALDGEAFEPADAVWPYANR